MVFSSAIFLYGFLPLVLAVYYLLPRAARNGWLIVASYFFYGWGNPWYVLLLFFSTGLDFWCARAMGQTSERSGKRLLLGGSILGNLGTLAFFKYSGFFTRVSHELAALPGEAALQWTGSILLPLGISFYTFQSLSYTIDVYRGDQNATSRFLDFAAYVSLFPQLVAGPIVRFSQLEHDLQNRRESMAHISRGIVFFVMGLSKKILIANPCGAIADRAFGAAELDLVTAWVGLLAYSFQIYFDFSGYSEMAIGLGLLFGFTLPRNFKAPYRATSVSEFWRRWHITLGSWVRDYLYIPLGGSRRSQGRTLLNLLLVMLLVGLWHGAAWQFVVWGALHGLLLAGERVLRPWQLGRTLPTGLKVAATFTVVSLCWVVFRAENLSDAGHYYGALFGIADLTGPWWWVQELILTWETALVLLVAAAICWIGCSTWRFVDQWCWWKAGVVLALLWASLFGLAVQDANPFLYFMF